MRRMLPRRSSRRVPWPPATQPTTPERRNRIRVTIEWLLGIATLGAFVIAALTLLPRITVKVSNKGELSLASFTITNTGYIPLHAVTTTVGVCFLQTANVAGRSGPMRIRVVGTDCANWATSFYNKDWKVFDLPIDEPQTIDMSEVFDVYNGATIEDGDIAILIVFQPWILPIHRRYIFHFIVKTESDGNKYWAPTAGK